MQGKQAPHCRVLVDFDGSIAPDDPTDRLLERFADPEWREVEAAWQAGEISSRECMARQVALLRASPEALDAADRAPCASTRASQPFSEFCRRHGAEVKIVSDGFDRVVKAALRKHTALGAVLSPTSSNGKAVTGGAWDSRMPRATVAWAAAIASVRTGNGRLRSRTW